jgi:diguanylate cyclase (GGDEF)-like protein/PAS domain S-box-containing protein
MARSHRSSWFLSGAALLVAIALAVAVWMLVQTPSAGLAVIAACAVAAAALLLRFIGAPAAIRPDTLQEANARLRADLEIMDRRLSQSNRMAGMGQWEWRLSDDGVWWSPEMCALYGVPASAAPTTLEGAFGYIHPDDEGRLRDFAAAMHQGRSVVETPFRIRRPNGEVRCVVARGERVTLANGEAVIQGVQQDVTELTHARRRLQLAEAQYRFLFEHTPLSMWVFDQETRQLLAVNDVTAEQYGYARDLGDRTPSLTMLDFIPAEAQPVVPEPWLRGDRPPQGEIWTHHRKDGTTLRAAIFSQDIEFDGRAARLVAAQDVTEQERNQQLFQLVARATSDAIYEWDMVRNALWISDSFFAAFGYERPKFPPTIGSWKARIHSGDVQRVVASLTDAAAGKAEGWDSEYSFQRGDGTYASVLHRGFFLRGADGRALRMVGGLIDLTEKRQVAADLRLLRRAVESTNTGIVITEASNGGQPIVYVNSGFEAITGYSSEEVLGRNCRFLQGDERDQPGVAAIRNAIAEASELRVTLKNFRKDGELFWNDLHLSPLHDDAGALSHYMGVMTDVTERHRYEEQLAYRATHDDLTGIPNRQLVIDRLSHAIHSARRRNGTVTVLFIDLDNFKLVNDTMGHASGDAVLRIVADRLAGLVRGGDTAGRFGGDEFVLILEDPESQANVGQVIERVARTLSAPMDIDGASHTLTMSIGHCSYPQDGGTADALLLHADIAMYHAKRRGRNRAVAYSHEFDERESTRLQLIARLREALANKEFVLAFQPLFLPSGQPVALEALVRWNHPEKGELLPGYFIGVCEESGLIVELERSVLAAAAEYHHLLAKAGLGHIRIAVNVSSSHFIHDLYADVENVVNSFHLPNGSLELELTESVIMESPETAIDTMTRLAGLGVSSTVDDFGTGYSSLAYLKRLPIVRVKIDRAFVRDLRSDLGDRSICESIISLARSMDLRTVAEGVETEFQFNWLKEHGVDEFQGYLLGRPAPFDEVVAELARFK